MESIVPPTGHWTVWAEPASPFMRVGNVVGMSTRTHARRPGLARKITFGVAGGLLVIVGVALLVLPGPGLLLVLGGLLVLANVFPAVKRFVHPVERRGMQSMEER